MNAIIRCRKCGKEENADEHMCPYGRDVTVGAGPSATPYTIPVDGRYSIDGGPAVRLAKGSVIGRDMAAKFSQMTRTQADMFNAGTTLVFTDVAAEPPPPPPPAPPVTEPPLEGPPDPPMPKYTIEVEGATTAENDALHAQIIALRAEADALRRQLANLRDAVSVMPTPVDYREHVADEVRARAQVEDMAQTYRAEAERLRGLLTTHEKDMAAMQETHAAVRALARTMTGMGEKTATVGAAELKRALATVGM